MKKSIHPFVKSGSLKSSSRILVVAACFTACAQGVTVLFSEGFETAGGDEGYGFVASATEEILPGAAPVGATEAYSGSINSYFVRSTNPAGSGTNAVQGLVGDYYFAAEDTDRNSTVGFGTGGLSWTVDISSVTDPLYFWGKFATPTNTSWPTNGVVSVEYQIDGIGGFTKLLQIVDNGGKPALDFNLDGTADGPTVSNTMTTYTSPITGNGNSLELHVIFSNLTGSSDSIGIDQFVIADAVPEPSVSLLGALGLMALLRRRRA